MPAQQRGAIRVVTETPVAVLFAGTGRDAQGKVLARNASSYTMYHAMFERLPDRRALSGRADGITQKR
jgi:hypothetical protein